MRYLNAIHLQLSMKRMNGDMSLQQTHPITARLPCAHLGGDALEDVFDMWPG